MTKALQVEHLCTDIEKGVTQIGLNTDSIEFPSQKDCRDRDLSTFTLSLKTGNAQLNKDIDKSIKCLTNITSVEQEIEGMLNCE